MFQYMGCAQINIQGSGTWTGSNFLSFPGETVRVDHVTSG
jgi:hypothetical protein